MPPRLRLAGGALVSLMRLEEFGIPRPGWPGRRRAIARLVIQAVIGAIFLIALIALGFIYLWLGVPAGAGYPQ